MKKTLMLLAIILFILVNLTTGLAQIKFLQQATVAGKLAYDQYSEYPYYIIGKKENVGLKADLDKTWRNAQLDKLVGKIVEVQGPMSVITAVTEYQGFKFIDISQGKGSLKQLR
jgi:hypothetical protein